MIFLQVQYQVRYQVQYQVQKMIKYFYLILQRGDILPTRGFTYDIKQSEGEAPVMLDL